MAELGAKPVKTDEHTSVLAEDDLELAGESTRAAHLTTPAYSALDPRALILGRAFGGFRVVRELASGGMASVFLARKDGPGRVSQHAAIKIVHPHLASQSGFIDMFLDEARIVACVHHPNVCRVLDFGTAEGTYYLAMEYVLGETWGAVQQALAADDAGKRALPQITAYVIAQACEGLQAAHEATDDQGDPLHIVHRDVSPQNIFVAYDGTVRVLDFGIARAADRITTTQAGTVKGRLAYMSPEQMEGAEIDPRADLWALGVVLREALENKRLFRRASDAETMLAVSSEPLPPWSVAVPPKLQEIAERALARDLTERYATASRLAQDLTRFVRAQAAPIGMPELSAWMHRLFPQRYEDKRALLQLPAPALPGAQGDITPAPIFEATPELSGRRPTLPPRDEISRTESALKSLPTRSVAPRVASVALFVLVMTGAALGVWLARRVVPAGTTGFTETHLTTPAAVPAAEPPPAVAAPRPAEADPPAVEGTPSAAASPVPNAAAAEQSPNGLTPALGAATAGGPAASADPLAHAGDSRDDAPSATTESERRHRRRGSDQAAIPADAPAPSPAAAPPPPQAAAGEPGTLAVAYAGGWAEIYLGEKLLGTTPGRFSLPSGRQTLTIKPFGAGPPVQRVVDVIPGAVSKLLIKPD